LRLSTDGGLFPFSLAKRDPLGGEVIRPVRIIGSFIGPDPQNITTDTIENTPR
jgi:hypothetical protein